MKILLIGPYPPPHGGISVHMMRIEQDLRTAGIECAVLNTSGVRSWAAFCLTLFRYAMKGWTFHLHTNGHNRNSWLIALVCGLAGRHCILTLHSGMAPAYIAARSRLPRLACRQYARLIGVNAAICDALAKLGVPAARIEIIPAFLGVTSVHVSASTANLDWIQGHNPVLSTALFFRPEYGFDLLMEAVSRLRVRYPSLGCVVMGGGDGRAAAACLVGDLRLEDNVLLAGDLDHGACLAVMSRSDVFVRPTREDGDSVSVREALSLGVPVVASRVGTRPEGAILFPAGNVNELIARIEATLAGPGMQRSPAQGSMGRLMSVYHAAA